MKPRTQKIVIPTLFVLVLAAIIIGMLALTSNGGVTPQSSHVSGHSTKAHKINVVPLPAVTTTTVTIPAPPPTTTRTVATDAPVKTGGQTTEVAPTVARPTVVVPTTVAATSSSIAATVHLSISGTTIAPDGMACTAGPSLVCAYLSAAVVENGTTVVPAPGSLVFVVYDNNGTAVGTFAVKSSRQTYCLVLLRSTPTASFASSSDCSGGPLSSTQTNTNFEYSAAFTQIGFPTLTTNQFTG